MWKFHLSLKTILMVDFVAALCSDRWSVIRGVLGLLTLLTLLVSVHDFNQCRFDYKDLPTPIIKTAETASICLAQAFTVTPATQVTRATLLTARKWSRYGILPAAHLGRLSSPLQWYACRVPFPAVSISIMWQRSVYRNSCQYKLYA